jgi:hypothetical protein
MISQRSVVSALFLFWASTTKAWLPSSNTHRFAMQQHAQQQERHTTRQSATTTRLNMAELEYNSERIRNFSIIAHIDHGEFCQLDYSYRRKEVGSYTIFLSAFFRKVHIGRSIVGDYKHGRRTGYGSSVAGQYGS